MPRSIPHTRMGLALIIAGTPALAGGPGIQVDVHSQGLTARAPSGAASLEVRLMGPARTVIFEQRSEGAPIYWNLTGLTGDGDYRYEAVAVTGAGDQAEQHVRPGGFVVEYGQVVIPPAPTGELEPQERTP